MIDSTYTKKPIINTFNGLKAVCVILIFYCHSHIVEKPSIEIGSRTCEILFLISGFLYAYNHERKIKNPIKLSLVELKNKLIRFYPLHLLTLFYKLIIKSNQIKSFEVILLNLLLLKSWSSNGNIYYSLNGVSWFLSSLSFCYLLSPIYLYFCDNNKKSSTKNLIILFILFLIRYFIEFFILHYNLNFGIHVFPPIRFIEYLMGMQVFYLSNKLNLNIKSNKIISVSEAIMLMVYICICYVFDKKINYAIFVLIFCPILYVLSYEKGIISKLLSSKPLLKFNKIQYEFYMIHIIVIEFSNYNNFYHFENKIMQLLFNFIVSLLISYCCKVIYNLIYDRYIVNKKINISN